MRCGSGDHAHHLPRWSPNGQNAKANTACMTSRACKRSKTPSNLVSVLPRKQRKATFTVNQEKRKKKKKQQNEGKTLFTDVNLT